MLQTANSLMSIDENKGMLSSNLQSNMNYRDSGGFTDRSSLVDNPSLHSSYNTHDKVLRFRSTVSKKDLYQFNKQANPKMNMIMDKLKNPNGHQILIQKYNISKIKILFVNYIYNFIIYVVFF